MNDCRFDDGSLFIFLQKDTWYFEQERSKENQSTRGKVCQRNKTPFSPAIFAFGGEYGETKRLLAGWHCRQ